MLEAGVDIIEIERIEGTLARHGQRFLDRVYTEMEQRQCRGRAESLAARFAAKEATFKVLGRRFGWREIEVRRQPGGKPILAFHGRAKERADRLRVKECSVSLSHSRGNAVAIVVASD